MSRREIFTSLWECQSDQSLESQLTSIMGFADLSIAEIADHYIPLEKVLSVSEQPGISDSKHQNTRLALEDVKAIISHLIVCNTPKR
ncbi:MAG: hypothetical protein ACHBN1_17255 [Heteroscytonema crispum UTEX LB 1556]